MRDFILTKRKKFRTIKMYGVYKKKKKEITRSVWTMVIRA